ncbi:NADPH-dependent FMN reductase [Buchananella hordeovulneris]|uniref:NADPH-dependent FMN reductase-like domain-containing protein n=1 Tax=Buchananella hordeovulneris TaxID=52770 RepID=A0A1Q5PYE6_9ACTO|nr:NADPH-dependent FMN reductase [Buchananella hordeovulneris]OKL52469.1 hypothetical protein BSZ40_03125 [Buchananella hordeovulneris]
MSDNRVRILALVGSLRRDSVNRKLALVAQQGAAEQAEIEIFEDLKGIPPFDEDDEAQVPQAVKALWARIEAADAVLVVTPEYNSSVPGQLKNVIDWASRPFATNPLRGKNVAVVGASPGGGGARSSIADAQRILTRAGATVIEETFSVARAYQQLDAAGELSNPEIKDGVVAVVTALATRSRGQL